MKKTTLAEKLWSKVRKLGVNDCWPWVGGKDKDGYGLISTWDGNRKGCIGAHRVMWRLTYGPIQKGKYICHKCDNPNCVNPKHLFVGDGTANMLDMWRKHRHPGGARGDRHGNATITETTVRAIRKMCATHTTGDVSLAFGLGASQISRIKLRRRWAHVL